MSNIAVIAALELAVLVRIKRYRFCARMRLPTASYTFKKTVKAGKVCQSICWRRHILPFDLKLETYSIRRKTASFLVENCQPQSVQMI